MSNSALDKVKDCINALSSFVEYRDADIDIRESILSDFLNDFGAFLTEKYSKHYSPSTAKECLRTLRKYFRLAISSGIVPNIDSVPYVISELEEKVWKTNKSPDKHSVKPVSLETATNINSLLRFIDVWHTKQRISKNKDQDRKQREETLQIKCVSIYLFCVLNYGIDIKDALSLKKNINDSALDVNGLLLPLSLSSKMLVDVYNCDSSIGEHLFSTLDNKKYRNDKEFASSLIEDHFNKFLRRKAIPLFKNKSVYIDYLNYAIDKGLELRDAETLWKLHLGRCEYSQALSAIFKAQTISNQTKVALAENWYLLNVFSPTIKRDKFLRLFLASGIMGSEKEAIKRIYAPQERIQDRQQGQSAVLGRYVFFRATPIQAQFANLFSPYAYVLKERTQNQFVQIRQQEIEYMQMMLRDFPKLVELVDGKEWLEKHNARIVPGCKAIIRSGSLAGKEATVVRIKHKNLDTSTYFIEFVEGQIKFQTDLAGVELEIVNT